MRQILETEDHVAIPPMMYSDPFYRITYLIKEEIRKYKWIEGEKGRALSWQQARAEWTEAHREEYEKFLLDTLPSADSVTGKLSTETENQPDRAEDSAEAQEDIARTGARLSKLPHRASG
jgi:hypothetical protein